MPHDSIFDSTQNQALLVVCARKTIRRAAIFGIIWGCINLLIGFFAVLRTPINAGLLALALLMLGSGITALRKPTLQALLNEAVVSLLILCWNFGITIFNMHWGYTDHIRPEGLIMPLIAAIGFFRQYKKLGYLKEAIATMDNAIVKEAASICKQIFKGKPRRSPDLVQASMKRCRLKLMNDSVLCVQRNLSRAFSLNRTDFQQCILHPEKKRIRMVVRHPLGKLKYSFNRKNSNKIKAWLGTPVTQS